MNDTKITNTVVSHRTMGDSTADIHRTREIARAFANSLSPALGADVADTLVLVVSELVTNAVRHGGGRYTLELSAGPDAVSAAVSDPNPSPPREVTPDLNGGSGGFGWHMVHRLTDCVTITPGPGPGKTINALIARTPGHSTE
ncbi:ATP-binding protein [Streptomyces sp. ISL-100]|uniref:ATP-binding protein n=1 Tax=Streptomyces sp. ISL-100 TaxID=2819173 RepID=UPI001BE664EB|nr:ATP-binding protein [Streptomyces sp. ISL-100]MBT2400877.1 ATP-binding protein [Streptomyces sp. ISL-100]